MHALGALRTYLEQHYPHTTGEELRCTCGAGNHARIRYFRVDGHPVTAIVPEGASLTAWDLREAIGCAAIEPLLEREMEEIHEDTELGHADWFQNPFGTTVFFDDLLLPYSQIVFCPQMFAGQRGECFRVPTLEFIDLTQALVLPLTAPACKVDDWGV